MVARMKLPRFQFRLRTLMIVVTLVAVACGYVGWEAKLVKDRKELHKGSDVASTGSYVQQKWSFSIRSWLRQRFGDKQYDSIVLKRTASDELLNTYISAFPEAKVRRESANEEKMRTTPIFEAPPRNYPSATKP
jgi:hypothetical protein